MKNFYDELINTSIKENLELDGIIKLRNKLMKKYKPKKHPTLIEIFSHLNEKQLKKLSYIKTKPSRTISGVSPVAIMTKPIKCPHGKCIMCPGGPKSFFGDIPQSYTGNEPATLRAIRNDYDPYLQIFNRLEQYILLGNIPDKIELIVMGGTFPSFPKKYQEEFITYSFKAINDFSELFFDDNKLNFRKFKEFFELPHNREDNRTIEKIKNKILKIKRISTLEKEQKRNETSKLRCVGLTIETRPDYSKLKHCNELLRLGCTRVELGIQSVYDSTLKKIERGHSVKDSIEAMQILKDLGFKINAHYMLGLPGFNVKKEIDGLKILFENESFKPDMLKIYPCIVLRGTKLHELYKKRKYKPLTEKEAIKIISELKRNIPKYVRIMRIQRDIPEKNIEAGIKKTNLRQELNHVKCNCIRCREAGRNKKIEKNELLVYEYKAQKSKEFFISFEDVKNNVLIGFIRLRFPHKSLRKEITNKTALIRELHIYSPQVEIGKKAKHEEMQHKGYGKLLLKKAEEIALRNNKNKMVVISGIGVREYYYKQGYKKDGPYVSKSLR